MRPAIEVAVTAEEFRREWTMMSAPQSNGLMR